MSGHSISDALAHRERQEEATPSQTISRSEYGLAVLRLYADEIEIG